MNINSRVRVYLRRGARSLIYQREYFSASDYTNYACRARDSYLQEGRFISRHCIATTKTGYIIMYACSLRIFIGSRERSATFKILIK